MRFSNGRSEQLKKQGYRADGESGRKRGCPTAAGGKEGKSFPPRAVPTEQTRDVVFSRPSFIMEIPSEDGIFH